MGFDLSIFEDPEFEPDFVEWLVTDRSAEVRTHFEKFWEYYINEMCQVPGKVSSSRRADDYGRCYRQAQEYGLPARITGIVHSAAGGVFAGHQVKDVQRKEVVIENDIAWRMNAGVDFLFGKPISIVSRSPDGNKRSEIEKIIKAVIAANGGISASPAQDLVLSF